MICYDYVTYHSHNKISGCTRDVDFFLITFESRYMCRIIAIGEVQFLFLSVLFFRSFRARQRCCQHNFQTNRAVATLS